VSRKNSSGARTPACRVHTRVNAPAPSRICARPRVVFRRRNQPRPYRIPLNIGSNPAPFLLASHPVIVRLALPKLFTCPMQQPVSFPRRDAFERFQQDARRNRGQQKQVDVVRHDDEGPKKILAQVFAANKRFDYQGCDCVVPEVKGTRMRLVKIAIHPCESFAPGDLSGWRKMRAWQTAMKVPGQEQPCVSGIVMRQTALGGHALISGAIVPKISRSHECERGTHECVRHSKWVSYGERLGQHHFQSTRTRQPGRGAE
jgi:hypothetical protein